MLPFFTMQSDQIRNDFYLCAVIQKNTIVGTERHSSTPIDLSIIIINHNTRQLLYECLLSLQHGNAGIHFEIIVVDNGSTDGSPEMVAEQFRRAILIRNHSNEGFAKPNNQGLKIAAGRYCMLLNSDTVVKPNAMETLIEFMDKHPEAGACGPRLVFGDGRLQPSCRSFPSLWRHFCDMSGLENLFPKSIFGNLETRFTYDHDAEVDQPMGAALMMRREVLEQVGYLDERFKIYYNEVDWCRRTSKAGWKIFFVHNAEIIHYGGKTTEITNRSFEQFDEMNRNCLSYYEKHFGGIGLFLYKMMLVIGFSVRVVLWRVASLLRPSSQIDSRLLLAKKFLALGLRFWERPTSK